MEAVGELTGLSPVTNGGEETVSASEPYTVRVKVEGTTPILWHRWLVESVAEKAAARKGSKAKKSDDLESYVYRDEKGHICLPGEYLRQAIVHAAKFRQDPRSPRKSAMDLFKAGVISLTELASLGSAKWDYVDQRRVQVQRNGITRARPAMNKGWTAEVELMVNLPEYISPDALNETIQQAGRLIGVGDFRPTYGRFSVVEFKVIR
jgi:hypothetical protein